jgi:hypothetical protein
MSSIFLRPEIIPSGMGQTVPDLSPVFDTVISYPIMGFNVANELDPITVDPITGVEYTNIIVVQVQCYLRPSKAPSSIPLPGGDGVKEYLKGWVINPFSFEPIVGSEASYSRDGQTGRFIVTSSVKSPYPQVQQLLGNSIEGWLCRYV